MRKVLFFGLPLRSVAKALVLPTMGVVTGLGVAVAVTAVLTPTYEARSAVLILPQAAANPQDNSKPVDLSVAQNLAPTLARLAGSREVAVDVANGLEVPDDEVFGHITGEAEPGIQIVTILATASTPNVAAARADAAAGALGRLSERLRLGGENRVTVQTLDRAGLPGDPTFPKPPLNYTLGAVVGLLAGLAIATLRQRVDDRFRKLSEVEADLGLPVLGSLSKAPSRRARNARALFKGSGIMAGVNATVASLSVLNTSGRRRILVTSVREDGSASYVAALLAVGLCRDHATGAGVSVVEGLAAPFGGSTLDRYFPNQVDRTVGEALTRHAQTMEAQAPAVMGFPALRQHFDSGTPHPDQIGSLVNGLAGNGDHVVFTAPPVMSGPGLLALARYADVVLVAIPTDRVRKSDAARAALLVRRLGVGLAGVFVLGTAADEVGLRAGGTTAPTLPLAPVWTAELPAARRPEDLRTTITTGEHRHHG